MKKKLLSLILLLGTSFFFHSCFPEIETTNSKSKKKIDEKEFLNHEIINDSIEYRIKEINQRNHVIRNLCVFKNNKVINEQLIYKVQKKEIHDEGYNTATKKMYEMKSNNSFEVYDYTFHYYDYSLEDTDTLTTIVSVSTTGEIELIK